MWRLTKNSIDDAGTLYRSAVYDPDKGPLLVHKFRLLDDDGIIYFTGLNDRINHRPLGDLGAAYGCTEIQYLTAGSWTTL